MNPSRWEKPTGIKTSLRTILSVALSPDGKLILVGGKPVAIEVYDTEARVRTTTYDLGIGGTYSLALAPDGLTFAAGGDLGLVICDLSQ